MKRTLAGRVVVTFVAMLFAVCASYTQTSSKLAALSDSPAARAFKAWLEAFNSGDRALLDAYYRKYEPGKSADDVIPFRNQTGGFELLDILNSEGLHLEFVVKERRSDIRAVGSLHVKEAEPGEVTAFTLRAIPQGASLTDVNFKIDAATRSRVIDNAISNLNEFYVFPEVARKMEEGIRARQGAVNMI
jgi:hypothetical protein